MDASIVIPSYNASERLYYNLLALNMQSYSRENFEVIVVDNGSKDDTWAMLTSFQSDLNLKRIRLQENLTRSESRNTGIVRTQGRVVIFSDSDMIVEKDFVKKHLERHSQGKRVVCGSNWQKIFTYFYKDFSFSMRKKLLQVMNQYPEMPSVMDLEDRHPFVSEEQIISGKYKDYSFSQGICQQNYSKIIEKYGEELTGYHFPWTFFITNNCSVDRESLYEAGLFDARYKDWGCEDLDMGYRLYRNGCSFVKEEIESIHQEHPIKHWENGYDNIRLFCEKHNAIDLLIYYFYRDTPIASEELNGIVGDAMELEGAEEYRILLLLFKDMLCIARDRKSLEKRKEEYHHRSQNCRGYLLANKNRLAELCRKAEDERGANSFAAAFKAMTFYLYKLRLEDQI